MDALALLCNLYGDGPATLRRLREAGCADFASVESMAPHDLAVILASSPVAARRFQREAKLLLERAGPESSSAASSVAEHASNSPRDVVLDRALAAWREMDSRDGPETEPVDELARDPRDGRPLRVDERGEIGLVLRADLLDGLDSNCCARLRQIGVETAEDLVACEPLDLAATVGIPLTRLMRFQSLARRVLGVESATFLHPQARPKEQRFSPDPLASALNPRTDGGREPTSGPFA